MFVKVLWIYKIDFMKYNMDWLLEAYSKGETLDYIFFWGHQPRKDGKISKTCMSQWWVQPFVVEGITYQSAEHWMMAGKAKLFNDDAILNKIIHTPSPADVKNLGRKVKHFDNQIWKSYRYEIVLEGNIHKFGQHDDLKTYLLGTGNTVLVEASPYDNIWGIGLRAEAENIENPATWKGLNLLGFALMETRDKLLVNT